MEKPVEAKPWVERDPNNFTQRGFGGCHGCGTLKGVKAYGYYNRDTGRTQTILAELCDACAVRNRLLLPEKDGA